MSEGKEAKVGVKRKRQTTPTFHFMVRWSYTDKFTPQKTEVEFSDLHGHVKTVFARHFDKYMYQLERGEGGRLHYQCYVHIKTKTRDSTLGKLLNADLFGVNVQPSSTEGITALQAYSMKADTRVAGPWSDRKIRKGWNIPTSLVGWQQQLFDLVKDECSPTNGRRIMWVYEPSGQVGKTWFGNYVRHHQGWPMLSYASSRDLYNLISKAMDKQCYIIDLPRTKPSDIASNEIYSVLEALKNGTIQNTKFECTISDMDPPHVIVFANYGPNLLQLSRDRWDVYTVLALDAPLTLCISGGVMQPGGREALAAAKAAKAKTYAALMESQACLD
ncbi:MAG: replication associated protein [Wigfec virus K19_221]|nr:MAG: replication associated protein [Wigfec virus K19_221]